MTHIRANSTVYSRPRHKIAILSLSSCSVYGSLGMKLLSHLLPLPSPSLGSLGSMSRTWSIQIYHGPRETHPQLPKCFTEGEGWPIHQRTIEFALRHIWRTPRLCRSYNSPTTFPPSITPCLVQSSHLVFSPHPKPRRVKFDKTRLFGQIKLGSNAYEIVPALRNTHAPHPRPSARFPK
ncbi:hypothetical protein BKA70DRAFT_609011 [Coprinopsis sp. MPI-PUGE-AT-0042]|nr:hypothetical protein BKA70DRAFT_609011 [Coprinopsis sp. MPI-PUGE-AT-0042]